MNLRLEKGVTYLISLSCQWHKRIWHHFKPQLIFRRVGWGGGILKFWMNFYPPKLPSVITWVETSHKTSPQRSFWLYFLMLSLRRNDNPTSYLRIYKTLSTVCRSFLGHLVESTVMSIYCVPFSHPYHSQRKSTQKSTEWLVHTISQPWKIRQKCLIQRPSSTRFRDSVISSPLVFPTLSSRTLTSGDITSLRWDQQGYRISWKVLSAPSPMVVVWLLDYKKNFYF